MINKIIDKQLKINTCGMDQYYADIHHNRYEPTDYRVLDRILDLNIINNQTVLMDFGCGKGRVDFYFRYKTNCKCIGIEHNYDVYKSAIDNLNQSKWKNIEFVNIDASQYMIPENINCFYFFNPFSVSILKKVISNLLYSYYQNIRPITLIFYYPNDEYLLYLQEIDELELYTIIDTNYIFNTSDTKEKVYIYYLNVYADV